MRREVGGDDQYWGQVGMEVGRRLRNKGEISGEVGDVQDIAQPGLGRC